MKNLNKVAIPLAAFALIATGALTTYAYQSHAQAVPNDATTQSSRESGNPMANLVKAIADKFGLSQTDVQQVFDDQHAAIEAQHQQEEAARLSQAVTDGKLTQDQADKITAKRAELESQREANKTTFQSQTPAERQAAMKAQMDSLKQWATDNNIPAGYLPFGGGHGGPGGFRGHEGFGPGGMHGNDNDADDATTSQN
ncbi:MAG TPA: hypothetical protein VHQ41_02065 [Patescibacteria group bacterium]|jgi:hypothetical protein|nr:hypothetical protein [Patescibacteria group bacterium]